MADLSAEILQAGQDGIAEAENDGGRTRARPISELIEADRYLASKDAAELPQRGMRITKLVPPGTV
jgi:hypothetical protein